jgi:hypothetical protein
MTMEPVKTSSPQAADDWNIGLAYAAGAHALNLVLYTAFIWFAIRAAAIAMVSAAPVPALKPAEVLSGWLRQVGVTQYILLWPLESSLRRSGRLRAAEAVRNMSRITLLAWMMALIAYLA